MSSRPAFLSGVPGGTRIQIKVQPRALTNGIGEVSGDFLKVRVTAPPVDHAANEAVLALLAEVFGVRRGAIRLVRGQASRQKVIEVVGLTPEEVLLRMGMS